MERKLAELSDRAAPRQPPEPAGQPPPPTREEVKQQLLQQRQAQLEAHQREPVDFFWAKEAHTSLAADFAPLTRGDAFRVRGIDCRTTTCVATVEWPSYTKATEDYARLLQHPYGLDCARSILLPEPEDPAARYEARLVLDCQNLRPAPGR
jgi:hypothetical protein